MFRDRGGIASHPDPANQPTMKRLAACTAGCRRPELKNILETAGRAALAAGDILRSRFGDALSISRKGAIDLVTEADIAAEQVILERLDTGDIRGDIRVVAEESTGAGSDPPAGPHWIIDPLDGTTNFAHAYPWFAVSIAYAESEKVRAGVILAPIFDELFCAGEGCGAWLNGSPIRVSRTGNLLEALLATGFPYDVHTDPEPVLTLLRKMLTSAQGVRRAGAATLDLANVACGRLDGFWEIQLKPWDTAAGQLLVTEAGGTVSDFSGLTYNPFLPEIAASNGLLHSALLDRLRG